MALFSPIPSPAFFTLSPKTNFCHKPQLILSPKKSSSLFISRSAADNGAGVVVGPAVAEEEKLEKKDETQAANFGSETTAAEKEGTGGNVVVDLKEAEVALPDTFKDPRWVKGTWDLKQFQKNGSADWDAVIDAGQAAKFQYYFLI